MQTLRWAEQLLEHALLIDRLPLVQVSVAEREDAMIARMLRRASPDSSVDLSCPISGAQVG